MSKILLVTASVPHPTDNGGRQRTNLLFRALSAHHEVSLLVVASPARVVDRVLLESEFGLLDVVAPLELRERLPWRWLRRIRAYPVDRLAEWIGPCDIGYQVEPNARRALDACLSSTSYDLIVGRYLTAVARTGALDTRLPVLLDVDDHDVDLVRSELEAPGVSALRKPGLRRRLRKLREHVPTLLCKCRGLFVCSSEDLARDALDRADVLPNIPYVGRDDQPVRPHPEERDCKTVMVLGTLSYWPNWQGIDYFVTNVWPRVLEHVRDAVLRITGSGLRPQERERWSGLPGVDLVGFVENLSAAYRNCAFTVVPVLAGGGTHVKILESLRFGRTCVITQFAHRGYQRTLPHETALLVGADADAMVAHCVDLLQNPEHRSRLSQRGAQLVSDHYSLDSFFGVVESGVQRLLQEQDGK